MLNRISFFQRAFTSQFNVNLSLYSVTKFEFCFSNCQQFESTQYQHILRQIELDQFKKLSTMPSKLDSVKQAYYFSNLQISNTTDNQNIVEKPPFVILQIRKLLKQAQHLYYKDVPFSYYFILVKLFNFPKQLARKVVQIVDNQILSDEADKRLVQELLEFKKERDEYIEQLTKHLVHVSSYEKEEASKIAMLCDHYGIPTDYIKRLNQQMESKKNSLNLHQLIQRLLAYRKDLEIDKSILEDEIFKMLQLKGQKEQTLQLFCKKQNKKRLPGFAAIKSKTAEWKQLNNNDETLQHASQLNESNIKSQSKEKYQIVLNQTYLYRLSQLDFKEIVLINNEYKYREMERNCFQKGYVFTTQNPEYIGEFDWTKQCHSTYKFNFFFTHSLMLVYPQLIQNFQQIIDDLKRLDDRTSKNKIRKLEYCLNLFYGSRQQYIRSKFQLTELIQQANKHFELQLQRDQQNDSSEEIKYEFNYAYYWTKKIRE